MNNLYSTVLEYKHFNLLFFIEWKFSSYYGIRDGVSRDSEAAACLP